MLGFEDFAGVLKSFETLGGRMLLGLIIFGLGVYLAGLASDRIRAAASRQSSFLAATARIAIIVFAAAIALGQLNLAGDIVKWAFMILLGGVAVAFAIASGMGGRENAGRILERWMQAREQHSPR